MKQANVVGILNLKDLNGEIRSLSIYDDFKKFPDYVAGDDEYIAIYNKTSKVGYLFTSKTLYKNIDDLPTQCMFAEWIDRNQERKYIYETQPEVNEFPIISFNTNTSSQVLIDEEDFDDLPFGAVLYVTGSRGVNGNIGGNGTNGSNAWITSRSGDWVYDGNHWYYETLYDIHPGSNGSGGRGGAGGRNGYTSVAKIILEHEVQSIINDDNDSEEPTVEIVSDTINITSGGGYGAGGGGGGGAGAAGTYSGQSGTKWYPTVYNNAGSGGYGASGGSANSLPSEISFNIPPRTKLSIDSITISTSGSGSTGATGSVNAGGAGGSAADGHTGAGRNGKNGGVGGTSSNLGAYSITATSGDTSQYDYEIRKGDNLANLLNVSASGTGGVQLNGFEYVPYSK